MFKELKSLRSGGKGSNDFTYRKKKKKRKTSITAVSAVLSVGAVSSKDPWCFVAPTGAGSTPSTHTAPWPGAVQSATHWRGWDPPPQSTSLQLPLLRFCPSCALQPRFLGGCSPPSRCRSPRGRQGCCVVSNGMCHPSADPQPCWCHSRTCNTLKPLSVLSPGIPKC